MNVDTVLISGATECWYYACVIIHTCVCSCVIIHTTLQNIIIIFIVYMYIHVHVLMRDEKEGSKKQERSNKQSKATQHTQGSHFS